MEIYRQTASKVSFEAPDANTTVSATASLNGGTPLTLEVDAPEADSKMRHASLPYVSDEGTIRVEWTFATNTFNGAENVTVVDTYDVVTSILTDAEIREVHPNATAEEILRIEKATRHIINAHTGQRFGRFVGTKSVRGNESNALFLPDRLLSLTSVNGASPNNFSIDGGGYILRYFPFGVPPVKADYYGLHMHTGGVIHNPNGVSMGTWEARNYTIDGTWGWEEVPAQVKEAAKLLVNDYACADQAYRDRYLTSMTAADWRIQFHEGAFARTGNVRADQLLSEFLRRRGWAVV